MTNLIPTAKEMQQHFQDLTEQPHKENDYVIFENKYFYNDYTLLGKLIGYDTKLKTYTVKTCITNMIVILASVELKHIKKVFTQDKVNKAVNLAKHATSGYSLYYHKATQELIWTTMELDKYSIKVSELKQFKELIA